ncbi:MAG TPA: hypothetical protein VN081_05845 [Dongiaceae bacterium]|nr:hypothetical protein [Dongiaceae bacterium]
MEHISQSNAQRFENGAVTSWEYEMQNANLNVAPILINGRYPENGYTSNQLSDSIVHIIGGSGTLTLNDGTTVELARNDQVHLAVGDAYYFEGKLELIYAASPAWTPEQTKAVAD